MKLYNTAALYVLLASFFNPSSHRCNFCGRKLCSVLSFESVILLLPRSQCACEASPHGPMAAPSAQARHTLQDAFERFASTVTPDDHRLFRDTQLKDVRDEAMKIERQLRARRMQRNMARLDPFLQGMEHYSKVVEVLCNGTPFLPWIWAPVKLMLMVSRTICQRPCHSLR